MSPLDARGNSAALVGTAVVAFGLGAAVAWAVVATRGSSATDARVRGTSPSVPLLRAGCYRRYLRLCTRWFGSDTAGWNGCMDRAEDVCSW